MQSVTKQNETRAIAAYLRARAMGSNAAQLHIASKLLLTNHTAKARFARAHSKCYAGLAEVAAHMQFNQNPAFVAAHEVQNEYLALRTIVRTRGAYTPYREFA